MTVLKSEVKLPLDLDHTCRWPKDWFWRDSFDSLGVERSCPACQYIRGYLDALKHTQRVGEEVKR